MGRILLSICAVVVAMGLGAAQSPDPIGEQGGRQGSTSESQGRTLAQAESAATASVQDSLQRIARNMEAAHAGSDTKNGEKRASRDLKAQEDMAWWAMWVFFATALGVALSGVGVFLIWRTLLYTRAAAEHGREMVLEAKKTTKAAQDSADSAQRVAGADRAWLVGGDVRCGAVKNTMLNGQRTINGFVAMPEFTNIGRSPARNITASRDYAIIPRDAPFYDFPDTNEGAETGAVLAPTQATRVEPIFLNDKQALAFRTGKTAICTRLAIRIVRRLAVKIRSGRSAQFWAASASASPTEGELTKGPKRQAPKRRRRSRWRTKRKKSQISRT